MGGEYINYDIDPFIEAVYHGLDAQSRLAMGNTELERLGHPKK